MDDRRLEYFVAAAEAGSFTLAAERLGVSQPALSKGVRRLEHEIGAALFARDRAALRPTAAGAALLPHARATLAALAAGRAAVEELGVGLRGTVRLGAVEETFGIDLVALVTGFRRRHPAVEPHLLRGPDPLSLIEQVLDGTLDVALTAVLGPPPPGLAVHVVRSDPMALLTHAGHPLAAAGRGPVTPAELRDEPFVVLVQTPAQRAVSDRTFAQLGIEPTVAFHADRLETALEIIRSGQASGLLPSAFVERDPERLRAVPLAADLPLPALVVARPATRRLSAAAEALHEALVAACGTRAMPAAPRTARGR